ncbi:hypothetical protein [Natronobacterium lacisalsi]|uniref:hypothetical protein n=1 Tax=Natronobacterium lacisalsi TaxID=229731 RepID=UPI001F4D0789|nr:hypothetical protein [Halobiforma lacisalsi]
MFDAGGLYGLISSTRAYLTHHPALVRSLIFARHTYYRCLKGYNALADPFELIEIDPNNITMANREIDKYLASGAIRGGNWDRQTQPYERSLKYRSVEQRFCHEKEWEETDIHDELCRRIETEGEADGCYSISDLERRYERIDQLYKSIKEHGYDPSQNYDGADTRIETSLDQICVSIGRDGELIFCGGGNHRFSIAKILDLDAIPVRVVVRHRKWQRKREKIANGAHEIDATVHPDFQDIISQSYP